MTDLLALFEKRVLTNVRLTQYQMTVLAMIIASPEGIAPDEDISKGPNLTSARTMLTKLGLITHDGDNKYSVSEIGMKVAKDENLIDDTGQLTELGNEKAYANQEKAPSVSAGPGGPSDFPAPDAFAQTSGEVGIPGPSESFKFLGDLLMEAMTDRQFVLNTYYLFDEDGDNIKIEENSNEKYWVNFTGDEVSSVTITSDSPGSNKRAREIFQEIKSRKV